MDNSTAWDHEYEQKLNGRAAERFPPRSLAGDDGISEVGLVKLPPTSTRTAVGYYNRLMNGSSEEHCALPYV